MVLGEIPEGMHPLFSEKKEIVIFTCPNCNETLDGIRPICKCKREWKVGLFGYYVDVPYNEHPDFDDYIEEDE